MLLKALLKMSADCHWFRAFVKPLLTTIRFPCLDWLLCSLHSAYVCYVFNYIKEGRIFIAVHQINFLNCSTYKFHNMKTFHGSVKYAVTSFRRVCRIAIKYRYFLVPAQQDITILVYSSCNKSPPQTCTICISYMRCIQN